MGFFTGSPGKFEKMSTLRPAQEPLANQAIQAGIGRGAGGAYGTAADYYRDLLSNDDATFNAMAAPETRKFNEQIIPQLSEQFAGMGAGGLSSSGFRNAAVNAGTDLSERLGAIRANLRQQGAAGLQNIGQAGLQQFDENIYKQGQPGLLDFAGPAVTAGLTALGGPVGGAIGNFASNWISGKGKSSPYGPGSSAQPYDPRRVGAR